MELQSDWATKTFTFNISVFWRTIDGMAFRVPLPYYTAKAEAHTDNIIIKELLEKVDINKVTS